MLVFLLLAAAVVKEGVKEGGKEGVKDSSKDALTPLRSGCSVDERVLAQLPPGAPLEIRYSISGESQPCYKVSAEVNGKAIEGFLPASAIGGLEDFDASRRQAIWLDTASVVNTIQSTPLPSMKGAALEGLGQIAQKAADLISTSHPQKALDLLQPELKIHRDPTLLALAGVAAWRVDDSRQALEYWRASLDLAPSPEVEKLYRQVERESKGDHSNDRLYGMRVLLRYDGSLIPAETARQMTAVLDQEFTRISQDLGCSADERVIAIVQSTEAYRKSTDSAEWNGGQFDGKIRVPIFDPKIVDPTLLRSLAHETTHACLSMLGRWPAWFQEGVAQKLSGDTLSPGLKKKLADLALQGKLPRLSNLKQDWSRLDAQHASEAYALSLEAVDLFWNEAGRDGVQNLLRNPESLPQVTAELDRKLGL
ncbi:MAG TPA: hypothetical protein VGJ09_00655 [Bryobacteraceae bacterium]